MRTIPVYPVRPIPPAGMAHSLAAPPLKGRGTAWSLAHRFTRDERQPCDDGWGSLDQAVDAQALPPATRVLEEQVKTILAGNDSPDIGFDLSINPYRGCEHVMGRKQLLPRSCPQGREPDNPALSHLAAV